MRIYASEEEARRARNESKARYDAGNTRHISMKFNRNTDADILNRLEKEESVQRYIKRLIREDIARNGERASDNEQSPSLQPARNGGDAWFS